MDGNVGRVKSAAMLVLVIHLLFIVKALNGMALPCLMPRGSFYAFPSIKPTGEGFVRCCFATSLEQLQVAMARMGRFVRRL